MSNYISRAIVCMYVYIRKRNSPSKRIGDGRESSQGYLEVSVVDYILHHAASSIKTNSRQRVSHHSNCEFQSERTSLKEKMLSYSLTVKLI